MSFLLKQIIEKGKNKDIFAKKYILSIPPCFGLLERQLIRKSAKLAEIDESKLGMISETSAAAIAYELNINKEKFKNNYNYDYDIFENDPSKLNDKTPGPSLLNNKNILVFDLGAGCFNLTIISINETNNQKLNFKVKANLGNPFFGGIDFDNKLVQYCISEFCKINNIKEEEVFSNKHAIKRLKLRCEIAKKILSEKETVLIYIQNFIKNYHLCVQVTRDIFISKCMNFFNEIEIKINKILKILNMKSDDIQEVLVIGGNSKIPKILEILNNIFGPDKVKSNIDNNKIIITGTSIYAKEMQKNNPNFDLSEIIFSSLGINVSNPDSKSFLKYGDKMLKLIRKNSSFDYESKFSFICKVSNNNKIQFNIYEGESNFVKYNKILKSIILPIFEDNMRNELIQFFIIFKLEYNYNLIIKVHNPEIQLNEEFYVWQFDENKFKKNKVALENKKVNKELIDYKNNLKELSNNYPKYKDDQKDKVLNNCCKCCENIFDKYKKDYNSENIIVKLYKLIEEMFSYYFERLKIKNKTINDDNEIILKIKEKMKYLKDIDGYNEILIDKFKEFFDLNKNIYYGIILNYIELIVTQNACILKNIEENNLDCFNKHFEKSKKILGKYLNEMNVYQINEELLKKIEILRNINNCIKGLIPGSNNILNEYTKLERIKDEVNNLIQNDQRYNCLKDILEIINIIEDLKNN